MKFLLKLLIGLVAVVVIAVVVVFFWINSLAKSGIEQAATYALGVNTTLDEARIGMLSGQFGLGGLDVANPAPYTADRFLRLGSGDVAVSLGSLMQDQVELPLLHLSGIELNLEYDGEKGNYDVILEHLQSLSSASDTPDTPDTPPAPQPSSDPESGKKFIIREVVIDDVTINGQFKIMGDKPTEVTFNIPQIRLTDIGSDSGGGVVLSQVAGTLLSAVLEEAVRQGGDILPNVVLGSIDTGLKEVEKIGKQVVDEAGQQIEEISQELGQQLDQEVDKVSKSIKDTEKKLEDGLGQILKGLGPSDQSDDK